MKNQLAIHTTAVLYIINSIANVLEHIGGKCTGKFYLQVFKNFLQKTVDKIAKTYYNK